MKTAAELTVILYLSVDIRVDGDTFSHDIVFPTFRYVALILFVGGLNIWPLMTYYWLEGSVATWGVWGTLIMTFAGSVLYPITVLFQVLIPSILSHADAGEVTLTICLFLASVALTVWYGYVDLYLWGNGFLVQSNRSYKVQGGNMMRNVMTNSEIEHAAGSQTYIESVPIIDATL